jgi:nucleotidyltransferase/DNA polymerase involved in DNA repair
MMDVEETTTTTSREELLDVVQRKNKEQLKKILSNESNDKVTLSEMLRGVSLLHL